MIETIIKSIISYVVPAILGFLVAKLINYKKKTDGLKNGVMIMLQSNLTNTFFYYESLKAMPDYVYKNFLNELKAYEDLGGDDYIHTIAEHIKQWEISRTDILSKGDSNEHRRTSKKGRK
jgi:hypothetical protein